MKNKYYKILLAVVVLTIVAGLYSVMCGEPRGYEFKLFDGTRAKELARAVKADDGCRVYEIARNDSSLLNIREPKWNNTLLMLAIANHKKEAFEALLKAGADVNVPDYGGDTALHLVCESSYDVFGIDCLYYATRLIECGADVNGLYKDRDGEIAYSDTPLMAAAHSFIVNYNNVRLVRLLVKYGAKIDMMNKGRETALGKSVEVREYCVTYELLKLGANYKIPVSYEWEDGDFRYDKPIYIKKAILGNNYAINLKNILYKKKVIEFLSNHGIK